MLTSELPYLDFRKRPRWGHAVLVDELDAGRKHLDLSSEHQSDGRRTSTEGALSTGGRCGLDLPPAYGDRAEFRRDYGSIGAAITAVLAPLSMAESNDRCLSGG